MGTFLSEKIDTVVDGETQEIWPKTAAWFLGPKVSISGSDWKIICSSLRPRISIC